VQKGWEGIFHEKDESAACQVSAKLPESVFQHALGTDTINLAPPQIASLAKRATEEWDRCIAKIKPLQFCTGYKMDDLL
jgi:hypothetical protein